MSYDSCEVTCPYCFESISLYIDPETQGQLIEDCEVCCRPWSVRVTRNLDGMPMVTVTRAQ